MLLNKLKILEGNAVKLVPICLGHTEGLKKSILDGELWKLDVTEVPHPRDVKNFILNAEKELLSNHGLTFTIIEKVDSKISGSTKFQKFSPKNKRVEIGSTFLGKTWQRTKINTETKLLMLTYAFEVLNLNRVEFFTDKLNNQSRKALLRLNACEEGLLRNHRIMKSGRVRDSIVYSVIGNEWKETKTHIINKLYI